MDTRDVLLLAYDAFGGEVRGKTNLQKKLYFLSIMLGIDLGYGPHYYGPYSSEVASVNTSLKMLGYLTESIASAGGYSSEGFEIARHDFELTKDGRAAVEVKKNKFPDLADRIGKAARKLNAAGELNYMELSIAAKAYFLLDQKAGTAKTTDLVHKARQFGWSVTEVDIERAVSFLERLGLAESSTSA
jgi:uncharacterized protein YwgA